MSLLIRKINPNNWSFPFTSVGEIGADALTRGCLKTANNCMSTFEVSSETDIDNAILALASNNDQMETFDIVILDKEEINNLGFICLNTPGNTPVKSLVETHRDISELKYSNIGILAKYIHECVSQGKTVKFTKSEIKAIIAKAIRDELITPDALRGKVKSEFTTKQ